MAKPAPAYAQSAAPPRPQQGNVILRMSGVSFSYPPRRVILGGVDAVVREGVKLALMGQNGAGKTTIFRLIAAELEPEEGTIAIREGARIATAPQVAPRAARSKTILAFLGSAFREKVYDLSPRAARALAVVHLDRSLSAKVGACSGGEQARLLLAYALIQEPDILLLDEPTNNLDAEGIHNLTQFLAAYPKTCIVISHDAGFLNAFTQGVLYLDSFTRKLEQYAGNYLAVVEEIAARIERERRENARLARDIANRREQVSFFAQKGGKMRDVARKMREAIAELEEQMVELRAEDRTIREFVIPRQELENLTAPIVAVESVQTLRAGKPMRKAVNVRIAKRGKLLVSGPNGIGKSTFLRAVASRTAKGVSMPPEVRISYYAQDFSELDFAKTAYQVLAGAGSGVSEEALRSTAAQFLLSEDILRKPVEALSEGQKGLLSMARIVLERPGLLVLDEPTNHINFRHLPVLARALQSFGGALILVSHMPEFVSQIEFDQVLDLGKL